MNILLTLITNVMAKIKIGEILKSVVVGFKDSVPVAGTIKENISSVIGGEGKVNYVRLVSHVLSYAVIAYALYLVGKGVISMDEIELLIKQLL